MPPLLGSGARFSARGRDPSRRPCWPRGEPGAHASDAAPARGSAALLGVLLPAGGNGLVTVAERPRARRPRSAHHRPRSRCGWWSCAAVNRRPASTPRHPRSASAVGFSGVALLLLPGNRPAGVTAAGLLLVVAGRGAVVGHRHLSLGRLPPTPATCWPATAIGDADRWRGPLAGRRHPGRRAGRRPSRPKYRPLRDRTGRSPTWWTIGSLLAYSVLHVAASTTSPVSQG